MAVWTKGFVATRNKSPFFVIGLIEKSLNQLIGSLGQVRLDNRQFGTPDAMYSRQCRIDFDPSSKGVHLNFVYKGEARQMTVYFGVDMDHKDYADSSVSLMMGDSGNSVLFIQTALNALRPLGELYFLESDANDNPFEKLDTPPMSYLEACRQHLVMPSCLSLEDWVKEFRTGTLEAATEETAFGFTLDEALRIIDMSYQDSADRIRELAGMKEEKAA
jgi:hypothetical protein